MTDPNRYQQTLDNIANDLRRWHQNVHIRSTGVDHLYTRDLILASDNLEDIVEDISAEEAYVRLKIGEVAALGTRITNAPMQMLYLLPAEAVPHAVVALDHVEPLHWAEAGRRVYERHFGNGVISFTARQLAVVLDNGANLSIGAKHEKPDYWSFEKPEQASTADV